MDYQIELRHLHYFKIVAEELHFRKAAERLFIAQPGLTRQIKQLEEYYQTELFKRNNRNVSLTASGVYLKQEVDLIFSGLANIKAQISSISNGQIASLKLGFIGSAVQAILPELLVALKQQQPLIDVSLSELTNELQIDKLLKEELDFGFIRIENIPFGLASQEILTEHFSLVLPKNHPFASAKQVDLNDFKDESFILFSKEYSKSYYELVISIFHDHGFQPNVTLRTVNALSIFNLVSRGLGVAIVPSSLKKGYDADVCFIELNNLPQRTTLSLVWNKNNRNAAIMLFLDVLKKTKR